MSTGILACSALIPYVRAAQKKMKTNYRIVEVDRNYHDRPNKLRAMLIAALEKFPEDADTILVAYFRLDIVCVSITLARSLLHQ